MLFLRLALTNLKKNRKTYVPYILTGILSVMMFYVMGTISQNSGLDYLQGAENLKAVLGLSVFITGIFTIIFLLYTNSFLVKNRVKEFGLYQVLGMDKRNLARMMTWEAILTAFGSIVAGIATGELLGRLMFLTLLKMVRVDSPLKFESYMGVIRTTVLLFLAVFTVTLLFNLFKVQTANPTELLHGEHFGEREPRAKWLMALFGAGTLGVGYFIAQTVSSPLSALGLFFIAVILVIVGTYCLFTAGSIAVLKLLKKNKSFFYQSKHFISVSGMIYRMKQNAVGLANICIMSTVVLVLVSVTLSLYLGTEDSLNTRYPAEIYLHVKDVSKDNLDKANEIVQEEAQKQGFQIKNRKPYRMGYSHAMSQGKRKRLVLDKERKLTDGEGELIMVQVVPLSDYNNLTGRKERLDSSQVLVLRSPDNPSIDTVEIGEGTFRVKEEMELGSWKKNAVADINESVVIIPDEVVNTQFKAEYLDYFDYFDLEGDKAKLDVTATVMGERMGGEVAGARLAYREWDRALVYSMNGGFLFLGVFVGALFLMATVLIIYYKQISEGYEDRSRYQIMQKVGMSRKEVQGSIKNQVLMVFFLPLIVAVVHVAFAFKVIKKLLSMFYLTNVQLFVACTMGSILCFVLLYAIVFIITSREYYKIVK